MQRASALGTLHDPRAVQPLIAALSDENARVRQAVVGGLGSIGGVIMGSILLVALPEVLREVQSYRMIALGMGLILMMIFRPQGLFGGVKVEKQRSGN
jgi:branched-chain amino acid transport system permease protein